MKGEIEHYFQQLISAAENGDINAGNSLLEIASVHIWSSQAMPRILEEYVSKILLHARKNKPSDCAKALNIYKEPGRYPKDTPTILRDIQLALWVLEADMPKTAAYQAVSERKDVHVGIEVVKRAYNAYKSIVGELHNKYPNKIVRDMLPELLDVLVTHSKKNANN